MEDRFSRTKLIYGNDAIDSLKDRHVIVFGVGGVGGYVIEALARSGVGELTIVDNDVVSPSNINRQIIALESTIGKVKVDVMKERLLDINPEIKVHAKQVFFLPENADDFEWSKYDYIVDAIDTTKAKVALVLIADKYNVPIISSMGTGNKTNPMGFVVTDINKTEVDPLAKSIRQQLRKLGIKHLKVVYSKEMPVDSAEEKQKDCKTGKIVPGSSAFVPSAAGLLMASEVVKDLIK